MKEDRNLPITDIMNKAIRSPSGDNCQPFCFRVSSDKLTIEVDEQRDRHILNVSYTATYLSLGCLIESIKIISSHYGFETKTVIRFCESGKPEATISFSAKESVCEDALYSAVEKRYTNRQLYNAQPLTNELQSALYSEARGFPNHKLSIKAPDRKIANHIGHLDSYVFRVKKIHLDLHQWLRWNKSQIEKTKDGMPWYSLGVSFSEKIVLQFAQTFLFQRVLNCLGFTLVFEKKIAKSILSSSALICISQSKVSNSEIIDSARILYRIWLRLTLKGLVAQPLSLSSLIPFVHQRNELPMEFGTKIRSYLRESKNSISSFFGLEEGFQPVWMLRCGQAVDPKQFAPTLRMSFSSKTISYR